MSELDAVVAALERGEDERALDMLVARWNETRLPAVGDLVSLLDARVRATGVATFGAELDALVTRRAEESRARLGALVDRDDPRLAAFVQRMIATTPFAAHAGARVFWRVVFDYATRICDPRLLLASAQLTEAFDARFPGRGHGKDTMRRNLAKLLAHVENAYPDGPPSLDDPAVAKLRAILDRGSGGRQTADELLAEIVANPDDNGARLVYADWLVERSDPLGELIALQINGGDRKREAVLLKENIRAWLGPLATVVTHGTAKFARGFLDDVVVRVGGPRLLRAASDRRWATVRRIESVYPGAARVLVTRAPLGALRVLDARLAILDLAALEPSRLPRIESIAVEAPTISPDIVAVFSVFAGLPTLQRIEVHAWDPRAARAAFAGSRAVAPLLEFVDLANGSRTVLALRDEGGEFA